MGRQTEKWIVVRNWERFQHPDVQRTETKPWIKLFTRILDDDDVMDMPVNRRWIFLGLLVLFSRSHGLVRMNTARLSQKLGTRVTMADLKALNHAGFIRFSASRPASIHASSLQAQRREEKRREEPKAVNAASYDGNSLGFDITKPLLREVP